MLNIKNPLYHLPIKFKLALVIFTAVCSGVGTVVGIVIYRDVSSMQKNSKQQIQNIIQVVSQDFLKILVFNSPQIAADTASHLKAFPQIQETVLYDKDNKTVFTYNPVAHKLPQPTALGTKEFIFQDDFFHVNQPIINELKTYGSVYFRVSADALKQKMQGYFDLLYMVLPFLLLGSLFVAIIFQRIFTRPILELVEVVHSATVSANYSKRIVTKDRKEIGQLYRGLNNMFAKIEDTTLSLNQQKERLHVTLESIGEGVIATDKNGIIEYMNPVAEDITAWKETDAMGQSLDAVYKVYNEATGKQLTQKVTSCLQGKEDINADQLILLARNSKKIAIKHSFAPILDAQQHAVGCVVVVHNVSESREMERKLSHQATHDALTNLKNRNYFERHLKRILRNNGDDQQGALMYIDLDQFKIINDTCGHIAGDTLLKQVAALLLNNTRDIDVVARLGGDEFGIILENCPLTKAMQIAEKIRLQVSELNFVWQDKSFRLGVSMGLVPICSMFANYSEIMSAADLACYAAKDLGRNRVHVYHEDDQDFARRHSEMHWVARINKALEKKSFVLYAQPIVPLGQSDHFPVYEVLIRLAGDKNELIPPGAFLPAAERYNLMPNIDAWVIDALLSSPAVKEEIDKHPNALYHVNLSGTTINNSDLADILAEKFSRYKIPARNICFEITETSAVANLAQASQFIAHCKRLGCKFALDDFGSGVSSFRYLKNLDVDFLKIDGSFVRGMISDPINDAMVQSINHIGHVMGIRTVAEFVENRATYERLHRIGVDFAQGFYLQHPVPLHKCKALVAEASAFVH